MGLLHDRTKKGDMKNLKGWCKGKRSLCIGIKENIQVTIDEAMNSTDPEVQANFKSCLEISVPRQRNISIKLQRK